MDLENMPRRYFWPLFIGWLFFSFGVGAAWAKKTNRNEWDV